jgi:low affinity Fe/Cu permease
MKKMIAAVALAALSLTSVAFAMSTAQQVDDAAVNAKIDERLHTMLVKMRTARAAR